VVSFGDESNIGDVKTGDVAGSDIHKVINHVYNVTTSLEQVTKILTEDVQQLDSRLSAVEVVERHHANERAAMTRLIIMLSTESKTVSDVQSLLEKQIHSETEERAQRRKYLDTMLTTLVILSVVNVVFHIFNRVFRRSGAAKP
jgi:ABC-type transporter Mla subunit MlaD